MLTKTHSLEILSDLIKQGQTVTQRHAAPELVGRGSLLVAGRYGECYSISRREYECWRQSVILFLKQSALFEEVRRCFTRPTGYSVSPEEITELISLLHALRVNVLHDILQLPGKWDANRRLAAYWTRLPSVVRNLYAEGYYAEAVFRAFVHLEEVARKRMKRMDAYGTEFMRAAMIRADGLLASTSLNRSQRHMLAEMYSGAMGFIKNPGSHRVVSMHCQDATELLFFANYLVRIVCQPKDAEWVKGACAALENA